MTCSHRRARLRPTRRRRGFSRSKGDKAKFRRPGLQQRWQHVVNSLERIIPAYELGSNRIALFADRQMRTQTVNFAVRREELVLDLGSGAGVMARAGEVTGGIP